MALLVDVEELAVDVDDARHDLRPLLRRLTSPERQRPPGEVDRVVRSAGGLNVREQLSPRGQRVGLAAPNRVGRAEHHLEDLLRRPDGALLRDRARRDAARRCAEVRDEAEKRGVDLVERLTERDDGRVVDVMRRVDLHAEPDARALCDGGDPAERLRAGAELDPHRREPELDGSVDLRREILHGLGVVHQAGSLPSGVHVRAEARRLETGIVEQSAESPREPVRDSGKPADRLEADDLDGGPEVQLARLADQLLERVLPGTVLQREAVDRDPELHLTPLSGTVTVVVAFGQI